MQRLAFRLTVIAVMAFTVFGIGKFANFVMGVEPANQDVPFQQTQLDAPLSDPVMGRALAELRSRHGEPSGNLTFPSPQGPVELSSGDVYTLNQRYAQMSEHDARMDAIAQQSAVIERESMDDAGWGNGTEF